MELKDLNDRPLNPACVEALVQYMYNQDDEPWPWHGHRDTDGDDCRGWSEVNTNPAVLTPFETDFYLIKTPEQDTADAAEPVIEGDCATHPVSDIAFLISLRHLAEVRDSMTTSALPRMQY